ncbi:unnamed protein product [Ectocarpus sp. 12 AP-2014]
MRVTVLEEYPFQHVGAKQRVCTRPTGRCRQTNNRGNRAAAEKQEARRTTTLPPPMFTAVDPWLNHKKEHSDFVQAPVGQQKHHGSGLYSHPRASQLLYKRAVPASFLKH